MPFTDPQTAANYRDAYDAWQKQIAGVHRAFLDGEKLRPDAIKGLLNREARAKEKYDAARLKLLGIDDTPLLEGGSDNPFR